MNVDSPTPPSRVGGRLTVVISHSRRYQNAIELYSALSRPVDVPTTIVAGPSWYPLIGVEIPGLPVLREIGYPGPRNRLRVSLEQ